MIKTKNKEKKWLLAVVLAWSALVLITMCINRIVDPYVIFEGHGFSGNRVGNLRFGKVHWLQKNHARYDAYILGSSRTSTYNPATIEKYDQEHRYYNLWVQMSTPDDQLKHLEYMLKNGWEIKKLLIQYDLGPQFETNPSFMLCRMHPSVVNSSLVLEYLRYLVVFPKKDWELSLKLKQEKKKLTYNLETGYSFHHALEARVASDTEKYIRETNDFHRNPSRNQLPQKETIDKKIAAVAQILKLAEQNHIETTIFIAPHHWSYLDGLNSEGWIYELEKLAALSPIYNFGFYSETTLQNANYYEYSHYRPHVTQKVIERLFSEEHANDFGILLDQSNIQNYLPTLAEEIKKRDVMRFK